jgi:hypothetical protein
VGRSTFLVTPRSPSRERSVHKTTLFSKKRNHFLTVGFHGVDGKDQVAIIELGKNIVRTTLPIMEVRSGKKILDQDEEARRSAQ